MSTQTRTETSRVVVARVVGLLLAAIVVMLLGSRALADAVAVLTILTWSSPPGVVSVLADPTPYVVGAVAWLVPAVVAGVLAIVVVKPGRSRRATALALVALTGLAVAFVVV